MRFVSGFFVILSCLVSSGCTETPVRLSDQSTVAIPCQDDDHCQYFIKNSKCLAFFCKCPNELLLSSDGSKCLEKVREYGSDCEDHVQCSQELSAGGVCEDGSCKCKSGFHYLKGLCWKDSDLHEKCAKDEHCFSSYEYIGLRCDAGVCKCRPKYYERSGFGCRRERKMDESCNLDRDCVDGTTCERMKCSKGNEEESSSVVTSTTQTKTQQTKGSHLNCPKGTFEFKGKCVLELGMNCVTNSNCSHIANAFCLDGSVCGCEPATFVASDNNRECLRAARGKAEDVASTSCKKDSQCGVFGGNSFCRNRRCACRDGSYWEKKNSLCWPIKNIGESCESTIDCHPSATQADCLENVCTCKPGYHSKGQICLPDAVEVGNSCENDNDCLFQNSFCNSSQVCDCASRYYSENGKCVPGVGTHCDTSSDCAHLNNTECKKEDLPQKQCLCLEGHSSSNNYKYCLPVLNFKEKCLETFQCTALLGDLGECTENLCQCSKKAHYSHGKCYQSKFIGEQCSRLPECYSGNDTNSVICLKGHCSCNYDYEADEAGLCIKTNSGVILKFHWTSLFSAVIFAALRR